MAHEPAAGGEAGRGVRGSGPRAGVPMDELTVAEPRSGPRSGGDLGSGHVVAPRASGGSSPAPAARWMGRYLIVGALGSGGMGVVYCAYDPELDRRVALKVLRPDPQLSAAQTSRQARLLREAQSLARLSHPNVIQVYDVGTFEDAVAGEQVFIAMELVAGESLSEWLRAAARPWPEVVSRFVAAGEGLAAAHAAGIVHRDFKPANVLVGHDGRVRVLDFGIARSVVATERVEGEGAGREAPEDRLAVGPEPAFELAPERGNAASSGDRGQKLTRAGHVVGTPRYIAPELVFGETASASADQFAFAVALFEALYGVPPFTGDNVDQLALAALAGRMAPEPTQRRVPTWLRRVVLRGLAADPAARYADMNELLADLRRDRKGERRRRLLLAAVPVALMLAAGTWRLGVVQRQAVCGGGPARLATVWDASRRQLVEQAFQRSTKPFADAAWQAVARALDDYSTGWLAMHREACEATQVRGEQSSALLDRRMQCLDRRRDELQMLTGSLSQADDTLIERAPQAANALSSLAECANASALLAPVALPADGSIGARVTELRADLAGRRAQRVMAQYEPAAAGVAAVLAEAERLDYAPLIAEARRLASAVAESRGRWNEAEGLAFEAAAAAIRGRHDLVLAEAATDLVLLVGYRAGRYEEGERWAQVARAQISRAGGSEELLAELDANLAVVFSAAGDPQRGLAAGQAALARYERLLPGEHPTIGRVLNRIGTAYLHLHDLPHAREAFERAMAQAERVLGPNHPTIAVRLSNLAVLEHDEGNLEGAIATQRRAMAIEEAALGTEHPQYGISLSNLGTLLYEAGRFPEALATYQRCREIQERALGPDDPEVDALSASIADVLGAMGRHTEALDLARRALLNLRRRLDAAHPWVLEAVRVTAVELTALSRRREATLSSAGAWPRPRRPERR